MATKKKLLQAAAGNAGGAALNVEDVFSTYLYTGNGSTQTVTNGIDLSGEGGLTWIKSRTNTGFHFLFDTERGAEEALSSELTNAEISRTGSLTAFNSNGFSVGSFAASNGSGQDYASWTFLKSKRFFDIQTWTGNGVAGREIPHNLGCAVGAMFIKRTDDDKYWPVYHRSTTATHFLRLNSTAAAQDSTIPFGDVEPTSTVFTVSGDEVVNTSGGTYVAYLFAHNDGDGDFGPDGDADIIKCGSYTNSGSAWSVDLGFEPQWLLRKLTDGTGSWQLTDNMRGLLADNGSGTAYARLLKAESSNAENNTAGINITSTGIEGTGAGDNGTYIYIAIRRGTAVPESATEVFAVDAVNASAPFFTSGFPVDMAFYKSTSGSSGYVSSRLTGLTEGELDTTAAFGSATGVGYDDMTGFLASGPGTNYYSYMWKRAPSYMDCVAYFGNSTAGRTVSHNLGVAPEMMWVKQRPYTSTWRVYHSALGNVKALTLNDTSAAYNLTSAWNSTTPTATEFTLGSSNDVNENPLGHIAYLFASLAGISKVGSVTHSGTTNVDCGFTSGARFVLLKRTDATGDWYIWDSTRGIVSGNDPYLLLNTTAAQVTNTDYIDPLSSGFTITSSFTAGDYIFYAIA